MVSPGSRRGDRGGSAVRAGGGGPQGTPEVGKVPNRLSNLTNDRSQESSRYCSCGFETPQSGGGDLSPLPAPPPPEATYTVPEQL